MRGLLSLIVLAPLTAAGPLSSSASSSSSSSTSTPSQSPTPSPWPCNSTDGKQTFALQVHADDYHGDFLGLASDGSSVVVAPSANATTTLWYLDDQRLYLVPETAQNASDLAGVMVRGRLASKDPWDSFEHVWWFDPTLPTCTDDSCYAVKCNMTAATNTQGYGQLECADWLNQIFVQRPHTADGYMGLWDEEQSAGGVYGAPGETCNLTVIPSCKL